MICAHFGIVAMLWREHAQAKRTLLLQHNKRSTSIRWSTCCHCKLEDLKYKINHSVCRWRIIAQKERGDSEYERRERDMLQNM